MVHGTVRTLLRLLEAMAIAVLIVAAFAGWRLSQGPVALDFLTPYVTDAMSAADGSFRIEMDSTVLTWAGWQRALDLRARGVRAVSAEKGVIAAVPEVSLTLSGRALLRGMIAPATVEVFGPHIRLFRSAEGRVHWGLGDDGEADDGGSTPVIAALYRALLEGPNTDSAIGHLRRLQIVDAQLDIDDDALGLMWRAPDADLVFDRDDGGIAARLAIMVDAGGELAEVDGTAHYRKVDGSIDVAMTVRDLRPDVFARISPQLESLVALDLPLSGSLRARFDVESGLDRASFDISGGAGLLRLPEPVDVDYPVASLEMRGEVIRQPGRLVVDAFRVDLGGPVVTANGLADIDGAKAELRGEAAISEMSFDTLAAYWPPSLAAKARDWVVANLSAGTARDARVAVAAHRGADGEVVIDKLDGSLRGDGVTVDYLSPMPKVTNASALATFDAQSFRIAVTGGEVYGLKLTGGDIVLSALDTNDEHADIQLAIEGPLPDALTLIDHQPLGYASKLGIAPKRTKGQAAVDLHLSFPLVRDLDLEEVEVQAKAKAKNVALPQVVLGLDLSRADLTLDLDVKGMDVAGPVVLGTIPAKLKWRENFSAGAEFRSRYQVTATIEEHQRRELRLDGPPFTAPWVSGPVRADVTATMMGGGSGRVRAAIDLEPAAMAPPGFGWVKRPGEPGSAHIDLKIAKERLAAIPMFSVGARDLRVDGNVAFDAAGEARRIEFQRLRYGRTEAVGELRLRKDGGLDITLEGPSFDAAPLLSKAPPQTGGGAAEEELPAMTIAGHVDRLWLSQRAALDRADLSLTREGGLWQAAQLRSILDSGHGLEITMAPQAGKRLFSISSPDAGGVFRTLDIFDNVIGGRLKVEGTVTAAQAGDVFAGRARVRDYHVVKAPLLARILTVASLTGIGDLLQGNGISFSDLDAPFTLHNGLLELTDTRAYGSALGLTANGQIDLGSSRMAVEGTIVPMYAINSVVGNIPLLGPLLTGEKGSGIFAATYSINGNAADPQITVNPLAALTPGVLRKFFGLFSGGGTTLPPLPAGD